MATSPEQVLTEDELREPGPLRHRSGVLHGRRVGRPLRAEQRARMARALPGLEIDAADAVEPLSLFGTPLSVLRMEIGFGGGEHLAAEAGRYPDIGFIGCEPFRNGVARMLERIETRGLGNVRLHASDAGDLLDRLPDRCLDGVDLLYPDPWPKRRQRRRRFVSEENLDRLARTLREGALFRFATDIDDYAGWVLARILRSKHFAWDAREAEDWRRPWAGWSSTRYEAKALREGRRPVYLTFVRTERP